MLLAPLDHQQVAASLLGQEGDAVLHVARVFDLQLLAGQLRAADAHQEHVLPWRRQEETEEHNSVLVIAGFHHWHCARSFQSADCY